MSVFYKGILTIIFIVLVTACGNSTSTTILDKNTTQNVPENNTTQNIPENNTTQNIPENNTTQNIPENNTTQNIPENNTTQNVPENNTTQNVLENNTTQNVPEKNTTQNIPENNISTITIYENAENTRTDKWEIKQYTDEANIVNTYDDERKSRVIYLDAKLKNNDRDSYDEFVFNGIDNNQSNKFIQWSMKFDQSFLININISTSKGTRWLGYLPKDTGAGINGTDQDYILHGIGSNKTNNEWHTITRDLERDLKRYEPNNNFTKINYIRIRGGGYIDDIASYSSKNNLEISKPVIVTQPGIVLTFDDSLAENWDKMQEIFKEKGAVATFFTNRWASHQDWDLSNEYIRLFKKFRDNGHEIGYHTSDHLNTRNPKYDNEENKAQAYFDDQIILGITEMRNKGFEPRSFSYPFISGQPTHNKLIRQELPHIREFFAHVTLIDNPGNISLEAIRKHLKKLKSEKDIGVFLSHWISSDENHKYKISKEKLIKIIDMVNELGLAFYTLEEAHNIYINQ